MTSRSTKLSLASDVLPTLLARADEVIE